MKKLEPEHYQPPRSGVLLLQGLIAGLFLLFGVCFWYLQVLQGEDYSALASENIQREELIYAPRGVITDREGRLLAINQPSYALAIVRERCPDIQKTLAQVSDWTGVDEDVLMQEYERGRKRVKRFEEQILVANLPFDTLAKVEAQAMHWPELTVLARPKRFYPGGEWMAHVLGYVAQANEEELNADERLALGDSVGKQGVEVVYEEELRGMKGVRRIEVDAVGRKFSHEVTRTPQPGKNLQLSIDFELQELAGSLLEENAGAVVVMDPFTGEILALASRPGYDPNLFVTGLGQKEWNSLLNDPLHPLQNRCIQSAYPPGSVFKLVMASAGLDAGMLNPKEEIYCSGQHRLGRRVFRCWKKHGHGWVDMRRAQVESCDVYFYQLGERLGIDRIEAFARLCGFGEKTGIELPHESAGLIPSKEWKKKRFNEPWQLGETLNISIGQGFTLTTPLQVARFVSAMINGGKVIQPTILRRETAPDAGKLLPQQKWKRDLVVQNMVETVTSDRGTARLLFRKDVEIGAKTGTAQVVKLMEEYEKKETEEIPYKYRDHAWMASFGRKGDRAYVIVAMVEHGGHGGSAAGPVCRGLYDRLFPREEGETKSGKKSG